MNDKKLRSENGEMRGSARVYLREEEGERETGVVEGTTRELGFFPKGGEKASYHRGEKPPKIKKRGRHGR